MEYKASLPQSELAKKFPLGTYLHYKGKKYQAINVARHTETLEECVVYHSLEEPDILWVRPLEMFLETVELDDGKPIPRFTFLNV
jgi:hypothetical protein